MRIQGWRWLNYSQLFGYEFWRDGSRPMIQPARDGGFKPTKTAKLYVYYNNWDSSQATPYLSIFSYFEGMSRHEHPIYQILVWMAGYPYMNCLETSFFSFWEMEASMGLFHSLVPKSTDFFLSGSPWNDNVGDVAPIFNAKWELIWEQKQPEWLKRVQSIHFSQ